MTPVRAVTFDFWDTLVADDSDEEVRAARGLPTKAIARADLVVREVTAHHDVPVPVVIAAWDDACAHFRHQWKVEHHTPHIADRLRDAFGRLGLGPTPGFDALVHAMATMEVEIPPRLAPGIGEALAALRPHVRIGIISDTIVTPGTGLRQILRDYGLYDAFDAMTFSDEHGCCKPSPRIFQIAADQLGVPVEGLAHVGDREANDVAGPHAAGARAVLYTGVVDRGSADSRADAVCASHADLVAQVLRWTAPPGDRP